MVRLSNLISETTLGEIDSLRERVSSHPEYSQSVREERTRLIESEAISHSAGLEEPRDKHGEKRRTHPEIVEAISRLGDAWSFFRTKYTGEVDHEIMTQAARILEPNSYSIEDVVVGSMYRRNNIRVATSGQSECETVPPVDAKKVPEEMSHLIGRLNDFSVHPLERAIIAHQEIARIHPFYDGNGRMARLVQNIMLAYNGFAPIVIEEAERDFYHGLIRCALKDVQRRSSTSNPEFEKPMRGERTFAGYLASKQKQSLERLRRELDKHRHYELELGTKEKGIVMGLKSAISNALKHLDNNGGFHRIKRDGSTLYVIGNLSADQLEAIASSYPALNSKFKLRVIRD